MKRIRIDQVTYDPHYYPRANGREDWYRVNKMKDALLVDPRKADANRKTTANWRPFPPIVVVQLVGPGRKSTYLILDGLHRLKAFAAAGLDHIWVEIEKLPKSKWLFRSAELNVDEKRGLDTGDKAWICSRLEADGYKRPAIAALFQMHIETLDKIMTTRCQKVRVADAKKLPTGRSNRRVNGGHVGFLKAPFADLAGTDKGRIALRKQQSCTSRDVAQILDAFIAVLESHALDMTDEAIAARVSTIQEHLGALV